MPTARCGLAVTGALDGRIFALGGGCTGDNLATVEAYTPSTNTWTPQPPMPTPRRFLAAATGRDGRIYAIGGVGPMGYANIVEAYTPSTNTWTTVAPMPTARVAAAAVRGADGRIYVLGGCCDPVTNHLLSTVEAYTPSTNTWSTVAPLPTRRGFLGAASGRDGRIYAIGGRIDVSGSCCPVTNVDAYTPATNTWESVAPLPFPIEAHAVALGADGRIYAFGGDATFTTLASVEAYDPSTNTWTTVAPMPTARNGLGAARGSDGRLYAVGGSAPRPDGTVGILDTVEALQTPAVTITPATGPAGTMVNIKGFAFAPGETVRVTYPSRTSAPPPWGRITTLCRTIVAANGTFRCTGGVPTGAAAGPMGPHDVVAEGLTSKTRAGTTFTLTP